MSTIADVRYAIKDIISTAKDHCDSNIRAEAEHALKELEELSPELTIRCKMCLWDQSILNLPPWFIHDNYVLLTQDMLFELYLSGANVMIKHVSSNVNKNCENLLMVDSRGFGQR